jgi:hypothetical protein
VCVGVSCVCVCVACQHGGKRVLWAALASPLPVHAQARPHTTTLPPDQSDTRTVTPLHRHNHSHQQITDTVYPMYKAFIEPDLQAAQLKIHNSFNPFTGGNN